MSNTFSHIDAQGNCTMVDVTAKPVSFRKAAAEGCIYLSADTITLINQRKIVKGNVLEAARLAGICAAKQTPQLIPLCHSIQLTHVKLDFTIGQGRIHIQAGVKCTERTGAEMEALTAVAIAALTIYDMCKAVDKKMRISDIRLVSKSKEHI